MLQMIEHSMRGGTRLVCGDRYDPTQQWLISNDAMHLYGYARSEKLPTGNFKYIEDLDNLDTIIRANSYDNGSTGYTLNVDLIVPKSPRFENYPLAPETKDLSTEQLSE